MWVKCERCGKRLNVTPATEIRFCYRCNKKQMEKKYWDEINEK